MAEKYHTSRSGKIVPCRASKRACPKGNHLTENEYIDLMRKQKNPKFDAFIHTARRQTYDPFMLKEIISQALEQELKMEQEQQQKSVTDKDFLRYYYRMLVQAPKGIIVPKFNQLNLVEYYFAKKERVTIPQGFTIRSTNPKYNNTGGLLMVEKTIDVNVLNFVSGSTGVKDGKGIHGFHPASLTWVGKDKYFYNVFIDEEFIQANT